MTPLRNLRTGTRSMIATCFDRHCPVSLLAFALIYLLSACTPQVDKGFETKISIPANGEIIFH